MTGIGSNTNSAPRASVLLVGCGNMGFAFLKRWLDRRDATGNDYHVVEPNADLAERARQAGATVYAGASELPEGFDPIAVFFAVKPDMLAAVAPPYSVMRSAVFVSFAAGVPAAFFEECLGPRPIVRAMPNIPVVAGCGTTVSFSNSFVTPGQKALVQDLLALGGFSHAVDREELIDVATAVSGSGPAYIFLIVDLIAEVAMQRALRRACLRDDEGDGRRCRGTRAEGARYSCRTAQAGDEPRRDDRSRARRAQRRQPACRCPARSGDCRPRARPGIATGIGRFFMRRSTLLAIAGESPAGNAGLG